MPNDDDDDEGNGYYYNCHSDSEYDGDVMIMTVILGQFIITVLCVQSSLKQTNTTNLHWQCLLQETH